VEPTPPAPGPEQPRRRKRRFTLTRLLLVLILAAVAVEVAPTPWAFHIGGRITPLKIWDGYGPVQASDGGHYLLYTHLFGTVIGPHGWLTCSPSGGCTTVRGSARVCTQSGKTYSFTLTGHLGGWWTTDGSQTSFQLTGGSPDPLPAGSMVSFVGTWHGPVLAVADIENSFTDAFTPAGTIRQTAATADVGTARVALRYGSLGSFTQACRSLVLRRQ
jgi:hypothetical protein